MAEKLTDEEKKMAEFLLSRGYEGIVPLYTAILIESIIDKQENPPNK